MVYHFYKSIACHLSGGRRKPLAVFIIIYQNYTR
ncbi:hypothetical protein [Coxiella burnetii]|uniref:Uncharacterized protein n=6 Tax=Coxiella burnetii TaxID=777 RepID=Q83D03_COXBU|nr:hypothetical protein [Coxiella burnetii]NP_819956.1 hypothetical protein CBU_0944 [Coxiella burnetii RSA 493]AAO90470.1 hypothetical protein CBU_0944 [Coxiella burnetii RSA 493]ACI23146.1 hypothetical protein CBUD_1127a [Coxiella burnetii Dugway 5J108-111]ACJ18402.1 hypothetical protein CbuG_1059 [Coxiella burnetii CbuG_Q212]ACJ20121.1 hypothetical protein CbuK_0891 [Coxiella burnetii CbuK_Q154]AIT63172.1 hypothetical protein CBNA_0876 [Coxiella burnetii str. Namibia]